MRPRQRLINHLLRHLSLFDMTVHNPPTRKALLEMDEAQVYNDLYEKFNFDWLPTPNHS